MLIGVRNHIEQQAWRFRGDRGVGERTHPMKVPAAIVINASVLRGRGRTGSVCGESIAQLRAPPPTMAPLPRAIMGRLESSSWV